MTKEFEGKNEQEAIEKAIAELDLGADEFEVEIIETESKKGLFFRKQNVRIRVHYNSGKQPKEEKKSESIKKRTAASDSAMEAACVEFLENIIRLMGYEGAVSVNMSDDEKIILDISSKNASVLIGKKGKNLDALQLLVNVYLNKICPEEESLRVVVDAEDYRRRREEAIIRSALKNAEQVVRNKRSRLLEPMNPFERRLIHTALNDRNDVITQSEGEGLYKQVRIIYKGSR
jgi:spoIIIJ-associated protein